MIITDEERAEDAAALVKATALAERMIQLVSPCLRAESVDFLRSYVDNGEPEVMIALAAQTAAENGVTVPVEVLDYLDEESPFPQEMRSDLILEG